MKTITLKYTLQDEQIDKTSRGLGWTETILDTDFKSVENPKSQEQYITDFYTSMIESKIKEIYIQDFEKTVSEQKVGVTEQIQQIIDSQKEIIVE